jgi:streptogrisin C
MQSPSVAMHRRVATALAAAAVLAGAAAAPAAAAPGFGALDAASFGRQLESTLGNAYAGFWMDGAVRRVGITDAAEAADARAQGLQPTLVRYSLPQLARVASQMDAAAASAPATVASWGVDVRRNAVVVSVLGEDPSALAFARRFEAGDGAVVIEHVAEAPRPLWNIIGGQAIRNSVARCSAGFNARAGTARYVLTAGHCGELGGTWSGAGGSIGPVARFDFPGDDFAAIQVTSAAAVQTALVDRYSAGSDVTVAGSAVAAVGSSVCRSGSTTGWHCGTVQAFNQTVNYGGGDIVRGLTRTNVCAEPGDSGGAFVSPNGATRVQAQGFTSGGSGNCRSGGTTFFQPVNEALSRYGVSLVTG